MNKCNRMGNTERERVREREPEGSLYLIRPSIRVDVVRDCKLDIFHVVVVVGFCL